MLRKLRPLALTGVVGGGALYAYDELALCQVIQRSLRAAWCGAAIFIDYKLLWTPYNASEVHSRVARRIVDTCKQNEGLYVKFGQVMGSMEMAMPQEFKGPLSELHDKAKTFDTNVVYDILREELSAEDLARITNISESPVASASVAQVHTAFLDGQKVAVKVQKPNIRVQNHWDMLMYKLILTILEYSFDIPLVWSYDYVRQQLESELDFNVEADNATKCREAFQISRVCKDFAYVPETFCSSQRVLVTEWIEDTVKITDMEGLRQLGLVAEEVVHDATNMFAYQIFGSGSVHCDPHPGNLLVRVAPPASNTSNCSYSNSDSYIYQWWGWLRGYENNNISGCGGARHQVVLIDHGLYVHLNAHPTLQQEYVSFWMAIIYGDDVKLAEQCSRWGVHDSQLFASMTLMRRKNRQLKGGNKTGKNSTGDSSSSSSAAAGLNGYNSRGKNGSGDKERYENEEGEDKRGDSSASASESESDKAARAERSAARHRQLKQRVKYLLKDTADFPHELGFVNRSVNYIRATNWAHGSPVDRVALFATAAARASAGDRGRVGEWSLASEASVWGMRLHLLAEAWGWLGRGKDASASVTTDVRSIAPASTSATTTAFSSEASASPASTPLPTKTVLWN